MDSLFHFPLGMYMIIDHYEQASKVKSRITKSLERFAVIHPSIIYVMHKNRTTAVSG